MFLLYRQGHGRDRRRYREFTQGVNARLEILKENSQSILPPQIARDNPASYRSLPVTEKHC